VDERQRADQPAGVERAYDQIMIAGDDTRGERMIAGHDTRGIG
jgi:hypothetical protein